jgi:hypothetical protein
MRREPPVVPRVAWVTADTTAYNLGGGGTERVTESRAPMNQPWADGAAAGAGAGAGAAVAVGVVIADVTVVVSLSGHSLTLCPGFPQMK